MNDFHDTLVFAQNANGTGSASAAIICLAIGLLGLMGLAQTFAKAAKPRWGAIIPIYNTVLALQIAQRPLWWIILFLIPLVNVVVLVVVSVDIARVFGKGPGFGWGLAFLGFIFFPILGFGGASYGPTALHDPADAFSRTAYIPKITPATKKQFEGLGVSLVDNYQGRGINVGFGRGSDISDDHLPALIPLGLNELYLSRTEISDESLAQFEAMVQLRVLDLSHTNLSRDGIKQLKESLPHAKIIG